MPDGYAIGEARFIMERAGYSAVNGLTAAGEIVPAGKVWTVLSAALFPSVAETQYFWYSLCTRAGNLHPITLPLSIALTATIALPIVEQGMEIKLFPGEYLVGNRSAATAGSTFAMQYRYVESDLPYYEYKEPLKPVVRKAFSHGSARFGATTVAPAGATPPTTGHGSTGGGGGGDLPV